jgi:small subunit ribosomal protein S2
VSYPIPGNDDAIRSVALLTRVVADAVADGLIARAGAADGDQKPAEDQFSVEEPLPEWERDLLEGNTAPSANGTDSAPEEAEVAQVAEVAEVAEVPDNLVSTSGGATAEALAEAEAEADSGNE